MKIILFSYCVTATMLIVSIFALNSFFNLSPDNLSFLLRLSLIEILGLISLALFYIILLKALFYFPSLFISYILGITVILYKYMIHAGLTYKNAVCLNGDCYRYNSKRINFIPELKSFSGSFKKNNGGNFLFEYDKRFCAYCHSELAGSKITMNVAVFFGKSMPDNSSRYHILTNPDVSSRKEQIDLSEIWIDADSADKLLIEKFITFLVNYPPELKLKRVTVKYRGDLSKLGDNCMNLLKNNFRKIVNDQT